MLMTVLSVAAGATLVLLAVRDVFDTLFHPQGRGIVSQTVIRQVWRGMRAAARGNHAGLSLAGPLAFIAVIVVWGGLVCFGFAFILWPFFPEDFAMSGAAVGGGGHFGDALYLSMVNLTSLGYGDIVATEDVLRFLGPVETLIGLGLLTASISWILLLHRVLSDYRSLSHEIQLLSQAERTTGTTVAAIEPATSARILAGPDVESGRDARRPRPLPDRLLLPPAGPQTRIARAAPDSDRGGRSMLAARPGRRTSPAGGDAWSVPR